ncbi:hypothetical protein CP980_27100 [Streptomyces vinaceus]|uniref:MarR family transcriptional regulator n=1 Tax=Streptomyces vinaceus TaxID=1960 RepID=A0A5J6JEW0_STRVI|nr:hypothetical protein [Streptomyces vinaceus]QEV48261.1 hypothetical protein CP980_27100 [Streptomyces vinaceus]GHE49104.1 hypothetical protein GCM10017778_36100 [Streptomyces vinaceus]
MTATPADTSAPLLDGRSIGIAYHAIAAVRDRLLAASGLTFHQSVALKAVADGLDRAGAADHVGATLRIGAARVDALLGALAGAGLVEGERPCLTGKGRDIQERYTGAVAGLTERLYADIPAAEREIAARALAHVAARANAELAAG